jgi:toxin-antitoxin system PIN domain toxin
VTILLDGNVLIALVVLGHVHHQSAEDWMAGLTERFATCPITEGTLLRALIRGGQSANSAKALLAMFAEDDRHEFWPDNLSYREADLSAVDGHRQVTDAYLVHLARAREGRVATFDRGMAAVHPDVVDLLPTD